MCRLCDPLSRNKLCTRPVSAVKIQQGEASKITSRHEHRIGEETRLAATHIATVFRAKVLHANGPGNLLFHALEDGTANRLFIDGTKRVEVPIVVVPESAWRMAAALRPVLGHA